MMTCGHCPAKPSEALMIVQLLAVGYLTALVADFIDALVGAEELPDVV